MQRVLLRAPARSSIRALTPQLELELSLCEPPSFLLLGLQLQLQLQLIELEWNKNKNKK